MTVHNTEHHCECAGVCQKAHFWLFHIMSDFYFEASESFAHLESWMKLRIGEERDLHLMEQGCWTWTCVLCPSVQGDSGGPLMCKLDGSWFQAAVLLAETNSTRQRADVMVFTKLSRFQTFLSDTVGSFLAPPSTNSNTNSTTSSGNTSTPAASTSPTGGAPVHSPIFLFNLLMSFACLRLFS